MKAILVGSTEIEVVSFNAYTYSGGRGEKVLQLKIAAENVTFEALKETLDNNELPIQCMEDDTLVCEYVGYNKFEAQYKDGFYDVELHMASVETQMVLLAAANERITAELVVLQQENADLKEQMENISVSGGASWDEMALAIEEGVNEV